MGSNSHDSFYREFFSDPDLIRQLIRDFLPEAVSAALDVTRLERMDTSFVGEHDQVRESDLIWKIYFKDGQPLYLYLLLEFQSTQDDQMPLRLLEYVILLYRTLIKAGEASAGALPPVMPVVLYNGDSRWTRPTSLDQMIQAPSFLRTWQPGFRFLLLDEGAFSPDQLEAIGSAVALLFEAEQATDRERLQRAYPRFMEALSKLPNYERLRRVVGRWIARSVRRKLGEDAIIERYLMGEFDMLAENFVRIIEQERRQGMEQGMQQGMRLMALGMYRAGMSIDTIVRVSGQDEAVIRRWIEQAQANDSSD